MGYNITLTNTIFDSENDNVILFNNKQELKTYWESKEDKITIPNINFIARNIINTEISIAIPVGLSLLKLLNYNYCIVFNETETLYFFIEESSQEDGNLVKLRLKIDAWNTYMYDIKDMQGLATRSHLDRFVKTPDGNYVFNFGADSPLFEREKIQGLSKRPTKKFKLQSQYDTTPNSEFNKWINDNVECWVYYFISSGKEYNYNGYDETNGEQISPRWKNLREMLYFNKYNNSVKSNFNVIVIPQYKSDKRIKFQNRTTLEILPLEENSVEYFLRQNNNYANVHSIKYSTIAPFRSTSFIEKYFIDDDNNLVIKDTYTGEAPPRTDFISDFSRSNVANIFTFIYSGWLTKNIFAVVPQQNIGDDILFTIPQEMYQNKFNKNEITNDLEPKLYNEDYNIYRLFCGGMEYDLPISKSSNNPYFIYKEILSPDITKSLLIFDAKNINDITNQYFETIFTDTAKTDFTGFITTLDNSLWFTSDNLDTFLANNKNNLQIFQNQQTSRRIQTEISGVGNIVSGAVSSAVTKSPIGISSAVSQAVVNGANTKIQLQYEMANYELTLDNMRNSKQELQSLNSNAILISSVDEFGFYIELQEILPFEKQMLLDYLKMFGYTYNRIADLKSIWKTRRYYNYVEMLIYEIDAEISNQVKDYIKEIFKNGVRIWHNDNFSKIDYNLNNTERSIYYGS